MASFGTKFLAFLALTLLLVRHTDAAAAAAGAGAAAGTGSRRNRKTWCVAKPSADDAALQANMEFACSESDCSAIQGGGGCARPDSVVSRASVAMNAYYQARGRNSWNCFFNGTGLVTITDPSLGGCKYV